MLKIFRKLPMSDANLDFYKYPSWTEHDGFSYCGNSFLCARLIKQPEKISQVISYLNNELDRPDEHCYILAWLEACEHGVKHVYNFALQDTDFGQVIRTCCPLSFLWSQRERMIFLRKWWKFRDNGIAMDVRINNMPKDGELLIE